GSRGGVGVEIELDRVPQRETGMSAYEIMLSESQERMLLVAEQGREPEVFRIFEKWGLDAVTVGRVTADGKLRVLEHGQVVAEIPNHALTEEAPVYHRAIERWQAPVPREKPDSIKLGATGDLTEKFKRLLAAPNMCSKRWIFEQYESMVRTNTFQGPGGDAGVIRVKGTERGLAMALDGNGRWCYLDPRLGAMHAVAEAARNLACVGAQPVAATNCLNFGNPEKPGIMYQFSQVVDGLARACEALGTPITGGNVSFYNETLGEGIYPTPVVGVVGILEKIDRMMTLYFRAPGRILVLLRASEPGDLADAEAEFGSSEYASHVLGTVWGFPPALELEKEAALHKCLLDLIGNGFIESAHDCSEGGLAVALAESAFVAGVGARVELQSNGLPAECVLFGEDASRVLISCDENQLQNIQKLGVRYGVAADLIGHTVPEKLEILVDGKAVVSAGVSEFKGVWEQSLEKSLEVESMVPTRV
ncbi:MAG: AIR synthase-related protein, partial [Terriglobales bacterium]